LGTRSRTIIRARPRDAPSDLTEARSTNLLGRILAAGKVVYKDGEFLL
jgi:hypothetical protein